MNSCISLPRTFKNTISEIEFNTGLTATDIGKGFILFCHWQKPNNKEKYLAIPVIEDNEQYYDLYPIPFPIEYEKTADSYGVIGQGAAKLLNIEQYYNFGYQCLKISQMLHSSEDCVFQIELMPN